MVLTARNAEVRRIDIRVGAFPVGFARTWAYPDGSPTDHFRIPTYKVTVSGTLASGVRASRDFEALRFGIHEEAGKGPRVVGLADPQRHVIGAWLPNYRVHSARSAEEGAWHVYGNFLIHDGPDNPFQEVYASIGCIEICNGPRGFDAFNDYIIDLSGVTTGTRKQRLLAIGKSRQLAIAYEGATRPPLVPWAP